MSGIKGKSGVYKKTEEHKRKIGEANSGHIHSRETRIKMSLIKLTENPSYIAMHVWVKKHKGRPEKCSICGKLNKKRGQVHWANKDHKYARNLEDYVAMCPKCHKKWDMEHGFTKQ